MAARDRFDGCMERKNVKCERQTPGLVPWAVCPAGIAALLGHRRLVWLNFAGGKSAATGLGVLLAMWRQAGID
jgi:glycerol-3-phosphate acyltransferase PlsY